MIILLLPLIKGKLRIHDNVITIRKVTTRLSGHLNPIIQYGK